MNKGYFIGTAKMADPDRMFCAMCGESASANPGRWYCMTAQEAYIGRQDGLKSIDNLCPDCIESLLLDRLMDIAERGVK